MPEPKNAMGENTEEKIIVELEKRPDSKLGFNIVGGSDSPHIPGHSGIFITKVQSVGAAAKNGRIKEGDLILSVNGESFENVTHEEAVKVFRKVRGKVTLELESGAEKRILDQPSHTLSKNVAGSGAGFVVLSPTANGGSNIPQQPLEFGKPTLKNSTGQFNSSSQSASKTIAKNPPSSSISDPPGIVMQRPSNSSRDFRTPSPGAPAGSRQAKFEIGDPVDTPKTLSNAPSTTSLVDDIPPTPKRPILLENGEKDSTWSKYVPEVMFGVVGLVAIGAAGWFVYKRYGRYT